MRMYPSSELFVQGKLEVKCNHTLRHATNAMNRNLQTFITQNNNENDIRYRNSHQQSSKGAIIHKGNFKRLLEFLQCLETPLEMNNRSYGNLVLFS